MPKVAIMGGGVAGCETAIELAKQGYEVVIIEQEDDILQGTSARTPGRMGLGYHYFDSETAIKYMKQTVEFMKHYSDCFLGDESTPHLMNGRYFVVKDSLVTLQELMARYDEVALEFEKMCQEDPTNSIFSTTHIHRTLHENEFENDVNGEKVAFAIETKERLLDWQKFGSKLQEEIAKYPNITIKKKTKVTSTSLDKNGKFIVNTESEKSEKFDYVVNCSWQNIEALDEHLGIGDAPTRRNNSEQSTTSRLKLLAEIKLPESLRDKPSMFFCVGPHAMFSNLGDGIGRITYAPITNFGTTTDSQMPEQFERWLSNGLSKEEQAEFGQRIIDGVAQYIPEIKNAELIQVIPGIVKSKGSVNIEDAKSPFHKRSDSGVEEQQIGWIDNAAMKLFYCLGNAKEVLKILKKQELAKVSIKKVISFAGFDGDWEELEVKDRVIGQTLYAYLQRNFKANDFEQSKVSNLQEKITTQAQNKSLLIDEIKSFKPSTTTKPNKALELLSKNIDLSKI